MGSVLRTPEQQKRELLPLAERVPDAVFIDVFGMPALRKGKRYVLASISATVDGYEGFRDDKFDKYGMSLEEAVRYLRARRW